MVEQKIKKGFKQTELGPIPEDWKIGNILDDSTLKARIGWQGLTTAEYKMHGKFYLVTGTDFKNGKISWDTCVYVDKKRFEQDRNIQLKIGDILVTKDGTIGKIAYVDSLSLPTTLNTGIFVIHSKNNSYLSSFLYYLFLSNYFKNFLVKLTAGSTITHLYQKDFVNFSFVIPDITEQKKIVISLSDTDKLIKQLDCLITKLKNIKQGIIQEFLTGRKRLEGFSGEWDTKKFGELLDYEQPTKYLIRDTNYNDAFSIPVLTAGKTFVLGYTHEQSSIFQDIPVIIFDDFTTDTKFVTFPFKVKSSAMKILKKKNTKVNLEFIFEMMQIIDFVVGDHKRYWLSEYQFLELKIPKINEQNSIMKIFSDMKLEINQLEKQRDKYINIKQGMMQKLLTGEIRLK